MLVSIMLFSALFDKPNPPRSAKKQPRRIAAGAVAKAEQTGKTFLKACRFAQFFQLKASCGIKADSAESCR
jgi:hypothetical protein